MSEIIDTELKAINSIIQAIEGLDEEAKKRVLNYILGRLNISLLAGKSIIKNELSVTPSLPVIPQNIGSATGLIDIRALKEQKQPKTSIQMAVLVAYYLQELAPELEKKGSVTTEDLTKYFKQANYPLPKGNMRFTLINAKNAGYFESIGDGQFKLNPVGYNLATFHLPNQNNVPATVGKKKSLKKGVKKLRKRK